MDSQFDSGTRISFDEYLACTELSMEWAESYDCKDWNRLESILAPTLNIQYDGVGKMKEFHDKNLPASTFAALLSWPGFLGDIHVCTQHLIGLSKFRKVAPGEIIGRHQIRAAHQRYKDITLKEIELSAHGHALVEHRYRWVDGEGGLGRWMWAGIATSVRWNEGVFERVFLWEENGNFEDWKQERNQSSRKGMQPDEWILARPLA